MAGKQPKQVQVGADWEGRLEEWLQAVLPKGGRGLVQDSSFPTDSLRDEYLQTIESRSSSEVHDLLRLFLFEASTFGADERNLVDFLRRPDQERAQLAGQEYYQRLLRANSRRHVHPGIRWVLDLLPNNPRPALAAIDAYLTAHLMVLPDGRINGLDDALGIIRARYIGRPATSEGKRQTFFELSPRDFERLVQRLYQAMGYETILTPPGRDGGRDVIATRIGAGQREQVQIECKLHTNPVGRPTVLVLLGVVSDQKANKGVLVTSSHFTRGARGLAADNPRLELISGVELVVLLNQYFGPEWPSRLDWILREFDRQRNEANPDA